MFLLLFWARLNGTDRRGASFTKQKNSPCPGTMDLENWGMMGREVRPGRTFLTLVRWEGVGDCAGDEDGLQSWVLLWKVCKVTRLNIKWYLKSLHFEETQARISDEDLLGKYPECRRRWISGCVGGPSCGTCCVSTAEASVAEAAGLAVTWAASSPCHYPGVEAARLDTTHTLSETNCSTTRLQLINLTTRLKKKILHLLKSFHSIRLFNL